MTELADLTLADAAADIRRGNLSARALLNAVLERVTFSEPVVHAYSTLDADAARAAASAADAAQRRGDPLGPLHGVPIAVDDLVDVVASVTTSRAPTIGGRSALADAPAVHLLRAAGAIVVGKTWAHELGLRTSVPPTRNSWDPRRAPGGSSAGAAVAVAVGSAAAAVGVDTGGSVRVPAALNGVVGYTPTRGAVDTGPAVVISVALDSVGTVTRSATDALLLFDVLTGRAGEMSKRADDVADVDVIRLDLHALGHPAPGVSTTVDRAIAVFTDGGAAMTPIGCPHPGLAAAIGSVIASADAAERHEQLLRDEWSRLEPATLAHLVVGASLPAAARCEAARLKQVLAADLDTIFTAGRPGAGLTVLAMPTFPIAPGPAHDLFAGYAAADPLATEIQMLVNLAGLPAVTLPCELGAERMPAGLQLVGQRGRDRELLQLAAWFQNHTTWHKHSPLAQLIEDDELEQNEIAPIGDPAQ